MEAKSLVPARECAPETAPEPELDAGTQSADATPAPRSVESR